MDYARRGGPEGFGGSNMMKCDVCDVEVPSNKVVEVRIARPSDPSDKCCVMVGCIKCFPPVDLAEALNTLEEPSAMLASEWDTWIEEVGHLFGRYFLS